MPIRTPTSPPPERERQREPGSFVTNDMLQSELRGLRWEVRFLVVLGLVLGQIGGRIDIAGTVASALGL